MNPFDIVKSISQSKEDLSQEIEFKPAYDPFIINRTLCRFTDCIMYVNDMNQYPYIDREMQYTYLINSIRPRHRFKKWVKSDTSEDVAFLMEYYNFNHKKAKEAISLLSDKQLNSLKKQRDKGKGGIKNE